METSEEGLKRQWGRALIIVATMMGISIGSMIGFAYASSQQPRPEPETWCAKRVLGYWLQSEKLTLNSGSKVGTVTCNYYKDNDGADPTKSVEPG